MSMAEATATVVHIVFAQLIEEGVLRRQTFDDIARDFDELADGMQVPALKTEAMLVAGVCRLIVATSQLADTKPGLHLVEPDEPPEDG